MNTTSPATKGPAVRLCVPDGAHSLVAARLILREYAGSLAVPECLTGFEQELSALPGDYATPRGQLLLAMAGDEALACCALRPLDTVDYSNACEIRRLYVRPVHRGLGLGRRLTEAQMDFARMQGYSCMLLDTLSEMEAARALYEDLGFQEVPPYYFNPIAGAHYLKVQL
jgi:ribosomal protein S18 acetylase RimI-like enzyme